MKKSYRVLSFLMAFCLILTTFCVPVQAAPGLFLFRNQGYTVPRKLQRELNNIYSRYNFSLGWGLYDISGEELKEVASYNAEQYFQSNCTIKAAMLLYICQEIDKGNLSLDTKLTVRTVDLHYKDFAARSGNYSIRYLLVRMIHVSNNACYEILLQHITKEVFNQFLAQLGSGTRIQSYTYMGNCTVQNRAKEWLALYKYCHSDAENAAFAWDVLLNAKYSPIRDGIKRPVAHKSGWHGDAGVYGTAADCGIVSTPNGGCYLMVMFTKNNAKGNFNQALMRELAIALDHIWNDYYASIPQKKQTQMTF